MKSNDKIKILSLNGGGVRGLFSISVLAQIEKIIEQKTGNRDVRVGDYFDLIAGSSIGGVLALGLASGKSARELQAIFYEHAPIIFPQRYSWLRKWKTLFSPRYDNKPLYMAVKNIVGEATFNDLNSRVIIPAINLTSGVPHIFRTPHHSRFYHGGRITLVDAAMATSAAPTYFAPYYCETLKSYFTDGGLIANNPSLLGLHEIQDYFYEDPTNYIDIKNIRILNIGTLNENYAIKHSKLEAKHNNGFLGLWGMGERLVLTKISSNQWLNKNLLVRELMKTNNLEHYIYIDEKKMGQVEVDYSLDNSHLENLNLLVSYGIQQANIKYNENESLRDLFCQKALAFEKNKLQ